MQAVNESPTMSLVLPLYNEADGIAQITARLIEVLEGDKVPYQLVLVNNGSTDGTAEILGKLAARHSTIHVTTVAVNQGYGWGILCGLREASGEIVGFMCADGQIAPEDIVRVYRCLVDGKVDLAKVVRISRQDGFKRQVMSAVYNHLFRLLFGVKRRDINGTPKLIWRSHYAELNLASKDWFIDAELMISAGQRDFRIGEVEVAFLARNHGASNVRLTTSLEFLKNMLRHRLRGRRNPA